MANVTYYLYTGAPNTFPNYSTWANIRGDFVATDRMGGGAGVIDNGVWTIKVQGHPTGAGNANMTTAVGISHGTGGSFVIEADTDPWNASSSNAMAYATGFDGWAFGSGEGFFCNFPCPITIRNVVADTQDGQFIIEQVSASYTSLIDNCVLQKNFAAGGVVVVQGGAIVRNSVLRSASTTAGATALDATLRHSASVTIDQCVLICNSASTNGVGDPGATGCVPLARNSYSGGATTPWGGLTYSGSSANCSSSSTDAPGNVTALESLSVSTTQFESVAGNGDWRAKSTSALATTGGTKLSAPSDVDAYGTTRQDPTTVGAYEALSGGGGGPSPLRRKLLLGVG
jgi:hypothetical protein